MNKQVATSCLLSTVLALAACTNDGPESFVINGGAVELTLSDTSSSNVDTSPLPPTDVGVVFRDPASGLRVIGVFANEPAGNGFVHKVWQLGLTVMGDPLAGATYELATPSTGRLGYDESDGGSWEATVGSILVESVSGTAATFSFSSISMTPSTGGSGNPATGTFLFSGKVTVDNIDP